ncbi:cation:proton antiporter [Porphyromonadaceae bacterium]
MLLPIESPVLIFFVVLAIILLAPILLNRLRIPHLIGMILAGALIGPNGIGLLLRDASFEIFGKVGLLYIMFLAGLEMDMQDFKKSRAAGGFFGFYTFIIPMVLGVLANLYILQLDIIPAVLLASMYASHTLVTYPIVSRYGINRSKAVTISVAGTIYTNFPALLILAIISGFYKGSVDVWYYIRLFIYIILFVVFVITVYPRFARTFFKHYSDNVVQFIFVLAMVFLAASISEFIGLEAIIGSFLAGIVLNRLIPTLSPLMNRLEFVGNALFIPYFLIGVGMLVDFSVLLEGINTLIVAAVMIVVATLGKWIPAQLIKKQYRMTRDEGNLIFGLTNSQAAATLAAVLIGYQIIIGKDASGNDIHLLSKEVLNGTILMILFTCTIASFATERAARALAMSSQQDDSKLMKETHSFERILIPLSNPQTIENLVNISILLRNPRTKSPLYALSINNTKVDDSNADSRCQKLLEDAARVASAADIPMKMISRYDMNVASGIINTMRERKLSEVVLGLHHKANFADSFFGTKIENLVRLTNKMLFVVKCVNPVNTIKRIHVVVPEKAEFETGFANWINRLSNMAKQVGCRITFYSNNDTRRAIKNVIVSRRYRIRSDFQLLEEWVDMLNLTKVVEADDLLVIVVARYTSFSYHSDLDELPNHLKYFSDNNVIILYPEQFGEEDPTIWFADPLALNVERDYKSFSVSDYFRRVFRLN